MTTAPVTAEVAEVLSPSQVRCFMDCQVRWWFKYGLKLPDPQTGKMALGKAVHAALNENFAQKLETREDLPLTGVLALFREAWINEGEHTEFRDDENPSELSASGEALVTIYMDEAAPTIDPAAVEMRVSGEIGGTRVQGWIDLLDANGRIIDIKTAARKPSGIEPDHRFQLATYAQLAPGASGEVRLDTLVKTKTPKLVTESFTIGHPDIVATQRLYALAQQAMRSELYMPNRLSISCSRRNCGYWRRCECKLGVRCQSHEAAAPSSLPCLDSNSALPGVRDAAGNRSFAHGSPWSWAEVAGYIRGSFVFETSPDRQRQLPQAGAAQIRACPWPRHPGHRSTIECQTSHSRRSGCVCRIFRRPAVLVRKDRGGYRAGSP